MVVYWLVPIAYLLGSVPTGYILGSLAGVDVQKAGSGNIGATNVARTLGKRQGIVTLLADIAKGYIPVILGLHLGLTPAESACVGIAAFLGHLYPLFLKFRGGKGVATALGVFLALAPLAALFLIVVFAVVILWSRATSLGSMAAAVAAPLTLWLTAYPMSVIAMSLFLAVMILVRHRGNIRRLADGAEPKIGS
ncbi:MAG: glycerol-3-phosphate 1-O-acyltransferase PlsY [Candidatus Binatia bacterium]